MPSLSTFESERSIGVDDHRLFASLRRLEKSNAFAARVVQFYEDPRALLGRKAKNVPRHADGLPKLTFAVFDGTKIHGFLDDARKRDLDAVLREIGKFARPPRAGTMRGVAYFTLEHDGDDFTFVVDYRTRRAFLDMPEPAPLPDGWARVFDMQKTAAGRKALADEESARYRRRLESIELRVSHRRDFVLAQPVDGIHFSDGKPRMRCFFGAVDELDKASAFDAAPSRWHARVAREVDAGWHEWQRVDDLGVVDRTLQTLLVHGVREAQQRTRAQNRR